MSFGSSSIPPAPMGDFAGFLLNWVAVRSRGPFVERLGALGLSPHQFVLLVMIDALPGQSQLDLVAATHIDPSTMVGLLDDLESAGLAERRPHPTDRRKRALHLTPAGEQALTAARETALGMSGELFALLEPGERDELHRLLRKASGLPEADAHA